jgi:putative transposase
MGGCPTDVTDAQWALVERLLNVPGKRGRRYGPDVRRVFDAVLYVTRTGCQWRCLPRDFGPWTRVWSQFRRWSGNGMWTRLLAGLHRRARTKLGRAQESPSMVVMDTHLARGASNGGDTFHARGGPRGATKGAKRCVAVDVTGLPLAVAVVPALMHENDTTRLLLEQLQANGQADRLTLVKVDRGVTRKAATVMGTAFGVTVERVGHAKTRLAPLTADPAAGVPTAPPPLPEAA